jgi:4-hydroxy-3-polyprenylbenzoate decarboxylase
MMPFQDLREFVRALEERDLLRRVTCEVDWDLEIGAIAHHLFKTGGRAALFERVKDADYPLLCGAIATIERYALGLGLPNDYRALQAEMMHAFTHRIPPVRVASGPCQENVLQGGDIDLYRFPTPLWHPKDGGRFIGTLGVVITRDPDTGKQNAGIYREMILERDKHGLLAGQHALIVLQKCQARGEPMPVATCFGLDPATLTSSVVPFGYGEDELELAGALRREPVSLVPCKTVDLLVPAQSEFVFEGYVLPDREQWLEEGPFGEYTGYYAGERMRRPTVQLTAITHRDDPIMQGTLEGPAPNESDAMQSIIRATTAKAQLLAMGIPAVQDVWVYARDMLVVVSLERQYYAGHARQVIDAVLATLLHKYVIVVDGDVDVFDWDAVTWAMGTNVLPGRDTYITDDRRRGFGLDPSIPPEARPRPYTRSSRIGIDATTQHKGYQWSTQVKPDAAMLQRVLAQWDEYGLGAGARAGSGGLAGVP